MLLIAVIFVQSPIMASGTSGPSSDASPHPVIQHLLVQRVGCPLQDYLICFTHVRNSAFFVCRTSEDHGRITFLHAFSSALHDLPSAPHCMAEHRKIMGGLNFYMRFRAVCMICHRPRIAWPNIGRLWAASFFHMRFRSFCMLYHRPRIAWPSIGRLWASFIR